MATKVLDYNFEDWSGSADTTPGYIFSTDDAGFWAHHKASTFVRAGAFNGGARPTHTGSYYFHRQFCTETADTYLDGGGTATSISDYGNIGIPLTYPVGYGSSLNLSSDITENSIFTRYYFRCVDNWKTNTWLNGVGNPDYGNCKFFRIWGTGGAGDSSSAFVHTAPTNVTDTHFYLIDPIAEAYSPTYHAGVDLYDGNWHSICVLVVRNNDTNSTGNITISAWFDDWNTIGSYLATRTITCTAFGSDFNYIRLCSNFSAVYPQSLCGFDLDNIEIWNGTPTSAELSGGGVAATPLARDGSRRYWRIAFKDSAGNETPWSAPAYFDMAIVASGDSVLNTLRQTGSAYRQQNIIVSGLSKLNTLRLTGTGEGATGSAPPGKGAKRVFIGIGIGI